MPLEHASWILPAIKEGYGHREELGTIWDKILAYLLGKKSLIGITGMAGVGKSVLFEYLTGKAYEINHPLPEQPSEDEEEGKMAPYSKGAAQKKRIRLVTIPGQPEKFNRYKAAAKLFEGKEAITGVVHVVANGLASIRGKYARLALQKKFNLDTVQAYQRYMLGEEIEDIRRTCELVKRSIVKHKEPVWMLVVATKCDLYVSGLDAVEAYYSPFADNGFVRELTALTDAVGGSTFSVGLHASVCEP